MRRTPSYLPPPYLSLIRLLTFASVVGSPFHALSTPASGALAATTSLHFDVLNATRTRSNSATGATIAASTATGGISTTTSALTNSKTSIVMSGSSSVPRTAHSESNTKVTPDAASASTASYTLRSLKGTSKFPQDFTVPKNNWASPDSLSFGSVLSSSSSTTADVVDRSRTFRNKHHHEHHWGPFFEEPLNSTAAGDNLVSTAHLFTEAVLNCRVGMLKDKTVMWVRRTTDKVSLLTVGNVTYSGDPRIRVKFQYPNNWRLLINPTQREDAGVYMCQVSTHPPRVFTTNLTILEPPLRLIDDQEREMGDRYYKSGSTIDLQCQVSRNFLLKEKLNILKTIQHIANQNQAKLTVPKTNAAKIYGAGYNEIFMGTNQTAKQGHVAEKQFNSFIFWTKDGEPLSPLAIRRSSATEKWISTRVSVPDAKLSDSGNYSCSIGKLFTAIVQVQVLTGELPAAVQHNAAVAAPLLSNCHLLMLYLGCIHCLAVVFDVISRYISPSVTVMGARAY